MNRLPTAEWNAFIGGYTGNKWLFDSRRLGRLAHGFKLGPVCDETSTVERHPLPRIWTGLVGEPLHLLAPFVELKGSNDFQLSGIGWTADSSIVNRTR